MFSKTNSQFIRSFKCMILISLIFSMNLFGNGRVYAEQNDSFSDFTPDLTTTEKQINQKFDQQEILSVIVELDVQFKAGLETIDGVKGVDQQKAIYSKQAQIISELQETQVNNFHSFQFIPFMSMQINRASFDILTRSSAVKNIYEDNLSRVTLTESVPIINADDVWAEGFSGAGQVVAILDTGVEKTHSLLSGKVVSEACYSTNSSGVYTLESLCPGGVTESTASNAAMPYGGICPVGKCDHGTHVAGIAAGTTGVAKDADILAIQVFSLVDHDWAGSLSSDQVKGLERVYALRDTYSIASVNMSLGGGSYSSYCDSTETARKAIIDALRAAGIATIIASGNDYDSSSISTPACISSAISVGATTDADQVASFSNSADILDLLAPGVGIISAIPNNLLASKNGTSMATPHVAGAWAVMKSANPNLDVDTLLALFKNNGVSVLDSRNNITKPRIDLWETFTHFIPAQPTNLTAEKSTVDQATLNWEDHAVNETGYQIQINIGNLGPENWTEVKTTTADSTSTNIMELTESTEYCFRVRAQNDGGVSDFSNTACLQFEAVLLSPSNLIATTISDTEIDLSWSGASGAEGYKIERSENGSNWTQIDTTTSDLTTYADIGLAPNTTYWYRVRAYNTDSDSDFTPGVSGTTQNLPAPTNLNVNLENDTTAHLTWSDPSNGEEGFHIERRKNDGTWNLLHSVTANQTTYTDSGLERGAVYEYRVRGYTQSSVSNYSNTDSVIVAVIMLEKVFIPLVIK
ncbi:MAG: hypothetical protein CL609_07765 [Anaerolineaceae bacterium]|nr:hypothetical protein [Anaerolineaceae bacterium]